MTRDFLSRWSRRKLEERREPSEPPLAPAEAAEAAGPIEAEATEGLSPEELAALPPLESLTAESDVAAFLRKGVPKALRNAALRRAWALDPEIRDYVGDARDYAYDWNVAGGVPGTGPIDPGTDIAKMVEDIFGRPPEADGVAVRPGSADAEPRTEVHEEPRPEAPRAAPQQAEHGDSETEPDPSAVLSTSREAAPIPAQNRHGGAKPA